MPIKPGTRYMCTKCGSEFIVTRPGEGDLKCHGQPLQVKSAPGGK